MPQECCRPPRAGDGCCVRRCLFKERRKPICGPGVDREALPDRTVSSSAYADEGASSLSLSSSSIAATTAKVKKQLLTVVVENDEWRVNNKYDRSRTPRPVEEIIRRAEQLVGKEVSYNVLFSNCEHFVTELRYGDGVSDQALNVIFGANRGVIGNALLAVADAVGITSVMSKPMT
ncbi:phospholipase A and acyltransferase 1-like [Passer montanus]|uniref:phospholipase A and acyltransferase 1-like n=1 Tax=Passer montanus TaxID=9160 RepID=UPI0019607ECD|nr:phospholipase A and acyltransferase 1-like [Passer montanus]